MSKTEVVNWRLAMKVSYSTEDFEIYLQTRSHFASQYWTFARTCSDWAYWLFWV